MRNNLHLFAAAAGMMLLILDAKTSAEAAAQAVEICIRTVIPSLFPFFVVSGFLSCSLQGTKWFSRLFRTTENCGGVIAAGLLSGYPVGAKTAAEAFRAEYLSRNQAERLLFFCSQAGPSFLFGMVAAQFEKMHYALILWAIQILSAATVAHLIPEQNVDASNPIKIKPAEDSMQSALHAMGAVCGWVIIFSVILRFLEKWVLWVFPVELQVLLCGMLELTRGCLMLRQIGSISLRFLLAAVMLNFGGVCVLLQTVSVSSGLKIRNYIWGKILQTAFSFLYACIFLEKWLAFLPILCIFFAKRLWFTGKRYSIPLQNGV